ncbi:hypothetical protein [Lactobacillus helveticus]|nr:hypothetical protein [Lactobacillus helveticus]
MKELDFIKLCRQKKQKENYDISNKFTDDEFKQLLDGCHVKY